MAEGLVAKRYLHAPSNACSAILGRDISQHAHKCEEELAIWVAQRLGAPEFLF